MALEFDTALRNAIVNVIETNVGPSPIFRIWSGSVPATCGTADSTTKLVEFTIPGVADWLTTGAAGSVGKQAGAWEDVDPVADGAAGYFRIYEPGGACRIQGTVTATGGGGDLELTSLTIATTQPVTIDTFTLTAGNNDA